MTGAGLGSSAARAILAVAVGLFGVVAAACGGSEREGSIDTVAATATTAPPVTGTTQPVTTTTTIEDVEAEVEAAYCDSFGAYYEAVEDPAADNRLHSTYRGPALSNAVSYVESMRARGEYGRFTDSDVRAEVLDIEVSGTIATVLSCEIDGGTMFDANGAVVNAEVVSRRTRSTLFLASDRWLVGEIDVLMRWPGAGGCDR